MAEDEGYCPDCRRTTFMRLHASDGSEVCTECGLVVASSYIDPSSDVRIFEDNFGAKRVEDADPLKGLTATTMQGGGTSSLKRLERQELRREKNKNVKLDALEAIEEIGNRLVVTRNVIERAQFLYHQLATNLSLSLRARKTSALLVACLHFVAKEDGQGQCRSLAEMAASTPGLTKKDISHAENLIREHIHLLRAKAAPSSLSPLPAAAPVPEFAAPLASEAKLGLRVKEHVTRVCNLLGFSFKDRKFAEDLAEGLHKFNVRRSPLSQAAAVVWIARKLTETPDQPTPRSFRLSLLDHTHVAIGTLRQTYKDMYAHIPMLLPDRKSPSAVEDMMKKLKRP